MNIFKRSSKNSSSGSLKPVRPAMSFPWFDASPQPVPKVRHSVSLSGNNYNLFWGDIHGHSNMSGDSWYHSPEQYYRYGRDRARLDFCALTDHDAPLSLARWPKNWEKCIAATKKLNAPGSFVAIQAFEWTSGDPSDSMPTTRIKFKDRYAYLKNPLMFGHRNVYFPTDDVPDRVFSHDDERFNTPEKLWEAIAPFNAICIPHHPLGGPTPPFNWDHFNPDIEPVVEIYSTHGNSECENCLHEIYNPFHNGRHSVQVPLQRGRRFGFIASSDTHMGLAGNYTIPDFNISFSQWYFRGINRPPGPGLAALYMEDLSRESFFESLRARRCYAVTGDRIVIDVQTADGTFMGGETKSKGSVDFKIFVNARVPVHKVEIIKNSVTVAAYDKPGREFEIIHTDKKRENDSDYIYVRVTQSNGHMAWSSPIWIDGK